jgi:hypothetical protein
MKSFILLVVVMGCASRPTGQLTDKAKELEVYGAKPANCNVVGKVIGVDKMGSKDLAQNHALNQSAELGATGMFVDQTVPNGNKMQVFATAYQCE